MVNVYFKRFSGDSSPATASCLARELLEHLISAEKIELAGEIPLKVHFGEPGNVTYLGPDNFDGVIDLLEGRGIRSSFIETSVLYGGRRYNRELHLQTAAEHGFRRLPVVIADGEHGEAFTEVEVGLKHFTTCKIGREFGRYEQLIVLSHFKGHMLAGFGGALKQLSMGHASKGGKLAMHFGIKPRIRPRKCKKCGLCQQRCGESAITLDGRHARIDTAACVGCGACVAVCPHHAVTVFSARGLLRAAFGNHFTEKIVEYAIAGQQGKRNLYLNFLMNITRGCDCEGRKMERVLDDIGILASLDPVAIDKASHDLTRAAGKRFRGGKTFAYAERVGLGSASYALREM